jgi:phosphatidylinositol-3-phosphatase
MENTSVSDLTPSAAPYLNSLFTGATSPGVELVRYQDTGVHPSLPNYLGLTGGDNFGITADGEASDSAYQVAVTNPDIATQLQAAGLTWHEYSEAQLSACQLSDSGSDGAPPGSFASKHDPMPHFLITQGTSSCTNDDVSYGPEGSMPGMAADIQAGTFYNYVFISPNLCDDGHDSCAPQNNEITQQDDWLSANVPLILNSSAYANNGFLFITWDEGSNSTDAIMAVALSPMLANPGSQDNGNYTHYSLLSTVEAGFGLSSLPQSHGHNDPLITTIWQ